MDVLEYHVVMHTGSPPRSESQLHPEGFLPCTRLVAAAAAVRGRRSRVCMCTKVVNLFSLRREVKHVMLFARKTLAAPAGRQIAMHFSWTGDSDIIIQVWFIHINVVYAATSLNALFSRRSVGLRDRSARDQRGEREKQLLKLLRRHLL